MYWIITSNELTILVLKFIFLVDTVISVYMVTYNYISNTNVHEHSLNDHYNHSHISFLMFN